MSDSGAKERGGFANFIYNPVTGEVFTRTPSSWAKIGLFYLAYYSALAAFFAGMLAIFLKAFTDQKAPVLTGNYSVLPQNPGMGFRPMPDIEKTLIKYDMQNETTYKPFVNGIKYFLKPNDTVYNYIAGQETDKFRDCKIDEMGEAKNTDKPCRFQVQKMEELKRNCLDKGDYGFSAGQPCVIVKLNKVFEFIPLLKDPKDKVLKIECTGEHPADKDNIGPIEYYPQDGFPLEFFPYLNQDNYLSPLVFAKFMRPQTGVLIQVVCKPANAANILNNKYSRGDGRVNFELMIESKSN
jgi:sodium/potassium-transporting ATPase subunit beta